VLEVGAAPFAKLTSPFAAVRLLGGSLPLAYAVQGTVTFALIVALFILWRSATDFRQKAAALMTATLIATPYFYDYDMAILTPALAFAVSYGVARGFGPFEKSGLAFVWITPALARIFAGVFLLPVGQIAVLLCFIGLFRRAWGEQVGRATTLPLKQSFVA
jgi:alpha-1,2-mannosyltransferase